MTIIQHFPILDAIRERPGMFVGGRSLTALYQFMQGYDCAVISFQIKVESEISFRFREWVAYRMHAGSFNGSYLAMILSEVPDEAQAFDRFYELREEYRNRKAKVVARVRRDRLEYTEMRHALRVPPPGAPPNAPEIQAMLDAPGGEDRWIFAEVTLKLPATLQIVVYTDDPGCFMVTDDPEDRFFEFNRFQWSLGNLKKYFGDCYEGLEVVDREIFDRLLREDHEYELRWKTE